MNQHIVGIAMSSQQRQSTVSSPYLQGDDKVDPRGRGSWWLGTLKVGVTLQRAFVA